MVQIICQVTASPEILYKITNVTDATAQKANQTELLGFFGLTLTLICGA
jgi:hypothetical protein